MLVKLVRGFLKDNLFTLNRQSIVDIERYIQTNSVAKSLQLNEVLLRPNTSREDIYFTTEELITNGEQKGWITYLDEEVLERTFQYLEKQGKQYRNVLSVNISAQTLADSTSAVFEVAKFEDFLNRLLDTYKININQLCLEITERIPLKLGDVNSTTFRNLQLIRRSGIKIALDDYGRGALDLDDLRLLCPDYLKIDGKFVQEAVRDEYSRKVIEFIVELARLTHSATIAEKVENVETLYYMRELGVDFAQGWYIDKSVPLGI